MADYTPMEDYGGPADEENIPSDSESRDARRGEARRGERDEMGDVSRPGEQFGEFDDTGTGTDLTKSMANTDVRGEKEA